MGSMVYRGLQEKYSKQGILATITWDPSRRNGARNLTQNLPGRDGLHAQALTLAALAGAAVVEYYDHQSGAKAERYAKFLPPMEHHSHKD
ncbi:hypothetical protein BVC80_23g25 [Macleaya cordata]|uniref:Uncharacterized protein n=1 Tax=Macleaya cordata TaxID=56857 RepID=A0A200PPS8_MACCD|nr:hypothetical protein BVC80_23g25 [Macleaya cordata]